MQYMVTSKEMDNGEFVEFKSQAKMRAFIQDLIENEVPYAIVDLSDVHYTVDVPNMPSQIVYDWCEVEAILKQAGIQLC